jgi:hypothetical protein
MIFVRDEKESPMNSLRKTIAGLGFLFLFAFCAYGQNAPLTKDEIIQMAKAGLPEDVIIDKVKAEANPPNFSADDLISLKAAGVSDGVIRALVSRAKPEVATANATTTAASTDPNDPLAPHDPGIYLMTATRESSKKMVLIERVGSGRVKTAHMLRAVMTETIMKAQIKAEVPGPRAAVRANPKPEFYMYFPPGGNLGSADSISNPSQFSLLLLEKKKDHRETTVAKQGFGRASAGVDEKKTLKFATDKLRAYVYRVTPDAKLNAGEYAFVAATGVAGTASNQVAIYDFGVDE